MKDYYKILGVSINSSEIDIKKQFRKLASKYHPDKNNGSKTSEAIFQEILNAYEILSDKEKRFLYNIEYQRTYPQKAPNKKDDFKQNINFTHENISTLKRKIEEKNILRTISYVLIIGLVIFYILIKLITDYSESNSDKTLNKQQDQRPTSGEIDFKN